MKQINSVIVEGRIEFATMQKCIVPIQNDYGGQIIICMSEALYERYRPFFADNRQCRVVGKLKTDEDKVTYVEAEHIEFK